MLVWFVWFGLLAVACVWFDCLFWVALWLCFDLDVCLLLFGCIRFVCVYYSCCLFVYLCLVLCICLTFVVFTLFGWFGSLVNSVVVDFFLYFDFIFIYLKLMLLCLR